MNTSWLNYAAAASWCSSLRTDSSVDFTRSPPDTGTGLVFTTMGLFLTEMTLSTASSVSE
jgi:hypothetical protein